MQRVDTFFINEQQAILNGIRDNIRNKAIDVRPEKTGQKKQDFQKHYFKTKIKSSPQNVHDSEVNNEARKIFHRIIDRNIADGSNKYDFYNNIKDTINNSEKSDEEKDRAVITLDTMMKKYYISSLDTYEDVLLSNIWSRINSPDNKRQKDN